MTFFEYKNIYGEDRTLYSGMRVEAEPTYIFEKIGKLITEGLLSDDIDGVIRGIRKIQIDLAYQIHVLKAIRTRVKDMWYCMDGYNYGPNLSLRASQSSIMSAISMHSKVAYRLEILKRDFQERKRIRVMSYSGVDQKFALAAHGFFSEMY